MPITPIGSRDDEELVAFVNFVNTALAGVEPLTCGQPQCGDCLPTVKQTRDFAHYSRDGIEDWKTGVIGNQYCWSQNVGKDDQALNHITDQAGRKYKMLCLVRVSKCGNLVVVQNNSSTYPHFQLRFAVPTENIARITLAAENRDGIWHYRCSEVV